jgi:hypothetical protein
MRLSLLQKISFVCIAGAMLLLSCKDDRYLATPPPIIDHSSFTESFDTVDAAIAGGWHLINASVPLGPSVWRDGGTIPAFFSAYTNQGSNAGFIGVDFLSTSAPQGIISQWLVSPSVLMQNGDQIIFYTKSHKVPGYVDDNPLDSSDFANRLQVWVNTQNESATLVGNGESTGSFTQVTDPIIDINPNQYEWHNSPGTYPVDGGPESTAETIAQAFPTEWTKFETKITGLSQPVNGRFAFRYFLTQAGSAGRGTGIGIDEVRYISISK